tara:strand:+ start:467 stop:703 length:237 start_codon:yes stop_codon:yes gene_type:complete
MAEYIASIGDKDLHVEYTYIPEQVERYPDTEPLRSHVEIGRIYVNYGDYKCDLTDIMYEVADDWLINLEAEIIEKLEG